MRFIYGTGNKGKITQVKDFFKTQNIDLDIISLKDINFEDDIIEDGDTFEQNSEIKANAIKRFCNENNINEIIVADDAGLCVDALDGRPGVLSARYAGDHAPQEVSIAKLLKELEGVPENKRTACFVCVLTAILPDGRKIVTRGETKGKIAINPGVMGKLTYDPVFMPDEYGKPMSEIKDEELGVTYRQKAFLELIKKLEKIIES